MKRFVLLVCAIALTGCAHDQLRRQTVHQADTVADVHTQQVLDNLAKFVHNSNSLPHFSYPNEGSNYVNQKLAADSQFDFSPTALTKWVFGVDASRDTREAFTMTPINDPRKLELMRCAYQRAVASCCQGMESAHCPDCDKRFNRFYLGTATPPNAQANHNGWPVYTIKDGDKELEVFAVLDPASDDPSKVNFYYVASGLRVDPKDCIKAKKARNSVAKHTTSTGKITSACLYGPCWFQVCEKKALPNKCCHVGHYCGTYVWVPASGMDQLTKLTMTILDYAVHDPVAQPNRATKDVIAYVAANGRLTNEDDAAYQIKATIPLDSDPRTVASLDPSRLDRLINDPDGRIKVCEEKDTVAEARKLFGMRTNSILNNLSVDEKNQLSEKLGVMSLTDSINPLDPTRFSELIDATSELKSQRTLHKLESARDAYHRAIERRSILQAPEVYEPVPENRRTFRFDSGLLRLQNQLQNIQSSDAP